MYITELYSCIEEKVMKCWWKRMFNIAEIGKEIDLKREYLEKQGNGIKQKYTVVENEGRI